MSETAAESGEIKIPRAEWVRLRRSLILAWNTLLRGRFELAQELYGHLVLQGKGKRGFDYAWHARAWAGQKRRRIVALAARGSSTSRFPDVEAPVAAVAMVLRSIPGERLKPRTVPKKILPWARPASTRQFSNHKFLRWTGHVQLLDKSCVLIWEVLGENEAIEDAWEHPLGQVITEALDSIHWVANTGGTILRKDSSVGSATRGETPSRRYGPLGLRPDGSNP